jgi:hypothetical protein
MTDDRKPKPGEKAAAERVERLAAALRANLKRRKLQLRAREKDRETTETKSKNPDAGSD